MSHRRLARIPADGFAWGCAAVGAALFVLSVGLPRDRVVLDWFIPVLDVASIVVLAVVAVLAAMDSVLRGEGRSLPLVAAAVCTAVVLIPHLVTFPGVWPGGAPGIDPQTASNLFQLMHVGTPVALALVLTLRAPRVTDPARSVRRLVALSILGTVASIAVVMAVSPALPPSVVGGHFTMFSRLLTWSAALPIAVGLLAYALGHRGDDRVSSTVLGAVVLMAFETGADVIVPGRYLPGWYVTGLLRLAPLVALAVGQFRLYARTVRERNDATGALADSEQRLRLTLEHAPIGLALVDGRGRWLQVNPALCAILGRTEAELVGTGFLDVTHPDDLDVHDAMLASLQSGEFGRYQVEKRYLRPDGSVVWVQVNLSLLPQGGDDRDQLIAQIQDVTGRREDEERLRLQHEIVHTMSEGVALIRRDDGEILFTNPQFDALYGYEAGGMIGLAIDVINAGDSAAVADVIRAKAVALGAWSGAVESVRRDGSRFWRHTSLTSFHLSGQGPVLVSIHSDVTEQRRSLAALRDRTDALARTNGELARSNADLGEFASVAAHDLKSPLSTIAGFAAMLRDGHGGPLTEEGTAYASHVVQGAQRLGTLVDDLLTYARVGTRAAAEPVDTSDVAADVLTLLRSDIDAVGAKVEVGRMPVVDGDPTQLRQLLLNLVGNALKFHDPEVSPVVGIASRPTAEGWELTVTDNGIGIDPRFRERVFKMFQRLHEADRYPGTGIGLAICRRVVENHGGRIASAEAPGGGTVFTVVLPIDGARNAADGATPDGATPPSSLLTR